MLKGRVCPKDVNRRKPMKLLKSKCSCDWEHECAQFISCSICVLNLKIFKYNRKLWPGGGTLGKVGGLSKHIRIHLLGVHVQINICTHFLEYLTISFYPVMDPCWSSWGKFNIYIYILYIYYICNPLGAMNIHTKLHSNLASSFWSIVSDYLFNVSWITSFLWSP